MTVKNLYLIPLLLILNICTSCISDNDTDSDVRIPVSFSLSDPISSKPSCEVRDSGGFDSEEREVFLEIDESEWSEKTLPESRTMWITDASGFSDLGWSQNDEMGIYMRLDSDNIMSLGQDNMRYRVRSEQKQADIEPVNSSLYFFDNNTLVRFFAYYPYTNSGSSKLAIDYTLPTDQTSKSDLGKADIMYACSLQANGSNPNVALDFSHKMVLLSFKVSSWRFRPVKLVKITVSGSKVTNTGILDLSTGGVETKPAVASFVVGVNQSISFRNAAYVDVIINPCTIGNNKIPSNEEFKVTFTTESSSLIANPSSVLNVVQTSLVGGKRYVFNVILI